MTLRTARCPEDGGRCPTHSGGGRPSRPAERGDGIGHGRKRGIRERLVGLGLVALLCGCSVNVFRVRKETLAPQEKYDELVVGETRLEHTLEKLGAPSRLEWKSGEDYLWYDSLDDITVGLAFRIPTPIFGYRHTFLRLLDAQEEVNSLQLVFDEDGVLRYKRLRMADVYEGDEPDAAGGPKWKLHLRPRAGYSFLLIGDGGEENYDDLFDNGYRTGVDIGIQPFPIATFLIGTSYQRHDGETLRIGGSRARFDDLEVFDFQVGVRVSVPFRIFSAFMGDFQEVKRIVLDDNLDRPGGLRLYVQGTTGGAFNNDVEVKIDGANAGDFYDDDFVLSSTAEAGIEYDWAWGNAYAGVTYQSMDAFEEGDSPLDGDGDGLQAVMVTGGLGLSF